MPRCNDKIRKDDRRKTARRNLTDAGHSESCFGNCYVPKEPGSWLKVMSCTK